MPPQDMVYRMLRALVDVATNPEMDTVSVVLGIAVTPVREWRERMDQTHA